VQFALYSKLKFLSFAQRKSVIMSFSDLGLNYNKLYSAVDLVSSRLACCAANSHSASKQVSQRLKATPAAPQETGPTKLPPKVPFCQQKSHKQQTVRPATISGMLRAPSADEMGLETLVPAAEESLGYKFNDKLLLLQALTHKSYVNEVETATGHNGAMEWLGDSVLQVTASFASWHVLKCCIEYNL
jgi:hypothetical protein